MRGSIQDAKKLLIESASSALPRGTGCRRYATLYSCGRNLLHWNLIEQRKRASASVP